MPVKDVKIYTGAAEGWVSIGDFASVSTVCSLTDVNCDELSASKIMIYDDGTRVDENGDPLPSVDPQFFFQYIGESQIGRPPMGEDWERNTIGWNFNNAGNLRMGGASPSDEGDLRAGTGSGDGDAINSEWRVGTIGYEIDSLRVMLEEGGGGSTPSLPPGENAGDTYDVRNWVQDSGILNQSRFVGRDGVFSNGIDWSVDGLQFARASSTVEFPEGIRKPVRLTTQGILYLASDGASFSYDMKNWYAIDSWSNSPTSGLQPISSVFVVARSAFIYARYRSPDDESDPNAWSLRLLTFSSITGKWANQIAGMSDQIDRLLAYPFSPNAISNGLYTMFTTHEQEGFVMGVSDNGMRITHIDWQGYATDSNALDGTLPCQGMVYGNEKICAKFNNGTRLTSDGTAWGTLSTFPQAANYGLPDYDDAGRWHICGPAGQQVVCYGEDNGTTIQWLLVSQDVPSGGSGDAYVSATSGRVIITQGGSPEYLITGQVDGVYTVDVKLTTTSGEIRSLTSPRLIISNAETQEDANNIFVDRFTNSGNLKLGTPDETDWAVGTIGEALKNSSTGGGDGTIPIQAGGRLTLESGVPVMSSDTVSSVLYYTPYTSATVSTYDVATSSWVAHKFDELTLDVSALAASTVYDIFIGYETGSGVLHPVAWADDKTRASEIGAVDGVAVASDNSAHRFIGTIRTNNSGEVESKKINRCIWNAQNQVRTIIECRWEYHFAYTTQTWIPYANNTTNGQARVSALVGDYTAFSMISNQQQTYVFSGVVLGDLSEPWNGGVYSNTPGLNSRTDSWATTPAIMSQVAPPSYTFVQAVVRGINAVSGASVYEHTTQGIYMS